jgi:hypothetical protein
MALIKFKNSETAGNTPASGDLAKGEPAWNLADGKLFTKDKDGNIIEFLKKDFYLFSETGLPVVSNQATLYFSRNRFYSAFQLNAALTFQIASSGNIPGNRITCIVTGDGESGITLPSACKTVTGSFNSGNGTKNLIEFQYFSTIIITKIYQIP